MKKRSINRSEIDCKCGCGTRIWDYDERNRPRQFVKGHQFTKTKTEAQRRAARKTINEHRPPVPWNKGKSYVIAKRKEYENRGAWQAALKRLFPDVCMRCGWHEAACDCHHLAPKAFGGKHTLDNGVILCPNCHRLAETGRISMDELLTIRSLAVETGERR